MYPIDSLRKLLGGKATLKTTLENEDDLLELVRAGLPYESSTLSRNDPGVLSRSGPPGA